MDDSRVKMSKSGIYVRWKAAKWKSKTRFPVHNMRNENRRKCEYLDMQKALKPQKEGW